LYRESDALFLAYVVENLQDIAIAFYDMDLAHYFTLSSYTWNAASQYTVQKLELVTYPEMYPFFELGLHGGISMISTRYASANDKFQRTYNAYVEDSYIIPCDCNNLYGFGMQEMMPISNIKWLKKSLVKNYIGQ